MPVRLRKLLGSLALIVFSLVYFWFVISVAIMRLPDLATGWHLLFYLAATAVWFIPAAGLVYWIQAPGGPKP